MNFQQVHFTKASFYNNYVNGDILYGIYDYIAIAVDNDVRDAYSK